MDAADQRVVSGAIAVNQIIQEAKATLQLLAETEKEIKAGFMNMAERSQVLLKNIDEKMEDLLPDSDSSAEYKALHASNYHKTLYQVFFEALCLQTEVSSGVHDFISVDVIGQLEQLRKGVNPELLLYTLVEHYFKDKPANQEKCYKFVDNALSAPDIDKFILDEYNTQTKALAMDYEINDTLLLANEIEIKSALIDLISEI